MPQPKIESSFHSSITRRELIQNCTSFAVLHPYTMFAGIVLALCWINLIEGSPMVCLGHTTLLKGQLQDQGSGTAVGGAVLLVQISSCSHRSSCLCSPQHFFNQNRLYWQKDLLLLMEKCH